MQRTQISLTEQERRLLDAEAARTGKSLSALIREAVRAAYRPAGDLDDDLAALDATAGTWGEAGEDGEAYVEALRTGGRIEPAG